MSDRPSKSELYSIYVETISTAEQRRQNASAVYFTLTSAAIAFWGSSPAIEPLVVVAPITVGSLLWFLKLYYFRELAKAKFKVLSEIETGWELKPFDLEWKIFKDSKGAIPRVGLTLLEMAVPFVLFLSGILYVSFRGGLLIIACWQ